MSGLDKNPSGSVGNDKPKQPTQPNQTAEATREGWFTAKKQVQADTAEKLKAAHVDTSVAQEPKKPKAVGASDLEEIGGDSKPSKKEVAKKVDALKVKYEPTKIPEAIAVKFEDLSDVDKKIVMSVLVDMEVMEKAYVNNADATNLTEALNKAAIDDIGMGTFSKLKQLKSDDPESLNLPFNVYRASMNLLRFALRNNEPNNVIADRMNGVIKSANYFLKAYTDNYSKVEVAVNKGKKKVESASAKAKDTVSKQAERVSQSSELKNIINGKVDTYSLASAADMMRYRSKENIDAKNANTDSVLVKTALQEIAKTKLGKELIESLKLDVNDPTKISETNLVYVVAVYQSIKGLKPDGIFGKNTFNALKKDFGGEVYTYDGKKAEVSKSYKMSKKKSGLRRKRIKERRAKARKRANERSNAWYSKEADYSAKMSELLKEDTANMPEGPLKDLTNTVLERFRHHDSDGEFFAEIVKSNRDKILTALNRLEGNDKTEEVVNLIEALKESKAKEESSAKIEKALDGDVAKLSKAERYKRRDVLLESLALYDFDPEKFVEAQFGDEKLKASALVLLESLSEEVNDEDLIDALKAKKEKEDKAVNETKKVANKSPKKKTETPEKKEKANDKNEGPLESAKTARDLMKLMLANNLVEKYKDDYGKLHKLQYQTGNMHKLIDVERDGSFSWGFGDEFTRQGYKDAKNALEKSYGKDNVMELEEYMTFSTDVPNYVYAGMFDGSTLNRFEPNKILYVKKSAVEKKLVEDMKVKLKNENVKPTVDKAQKGVAQRVKKGVEAAESTADATGKGREVASDVKTKAESNANAQGKGSEVGSDVKKSAEGVAESAPGKNDEKPKAKESLSEEKTFNVEDAVRVDNPLY